MITINIVSKYLQSYRDHQADIQRIDDEYWDDYQDFGTHREFLKDELKALRAKSMVNSKFDIEAFASHIHISDDFNRDAKKINQECIDEIVRDTKQLAESHQGIQQSAKDHELMSDEADRQQKQWFDKQVKISADSALMHAIDTVTLKMNNLQLKYDSEVSEHTDNKIINLTTYSVILLMLDIFLNLNGNTSNVLTSFSLGIATSVAILTVITPMFFKSAVFRMKLIRSNTIMIAICTVVSLISILI